MPESTATPRAVAERLLAAIVSGEPDQVARLYAPELEIELPFGPPLLPARVASGRTQVREQLTAGTAVRRYLRVEDVAIHEAGDGETVVAEYTIHGEHLPGREPFQLPFAMVMTVRDGVIVHTRDYSDPVAGARLLGREDELIEHLSSGS